MERVYVGAEEWIEKQWPSIMFFDQRVHARAIFIDLACVRFSSASIPERFESFSAIKRCLSIFR